MAKAATNDKVMDVKSPGKTTPSSSTRPLVVTNRPVLASDPMVVPANADPAAGQVAAPAASAEQVVHSAKKIQPINADVKPEEETSAEPTEAIETSAPSEEKPAAEAEPTAEPETSVPTPEKAEEPTPQDTPPSEETPTSSTGIPEGELRDPEAEKTKVEAAELEAEAKRNEELETIVASGKYAVPIDAQHKKRSQTQALIATLVILLAVAVVLDILLDMGTLTLPVELPHTNFFTT